MTKMLDVELPCDEHGNDPNDFRWHEGYIEQLVGREQPDVPSSGLVRADELIKNVTGTQYLIKPYLETDCVGTIFGDSDTYKSFLMLDIGLHLATGTDYHGHHVHQCPVVYIAGEGHGGIGRRVLAWSVKRGINLDNQPFYITKIPAQLIEAGNAQEIARIIKEVCPETPGMIVIDTLSTNIGEGDESSNSDMAVLLNNVNEYIRKPTGACIPIVAHVGHGDKNRERGAYALRGNVEFRINVQREGALSDRRCTLYSIKVKDGEIFPPAAFQAEQIDLPDVFDSEGEQATSLVMKAIEYVAPKTEKQLPEKTEQCLVVLRDLFQQATTNLETSGYSPDGARVESNTWRDECLRRKLITGRTKASKTAQFRRIKKDLKDNSLIDVDGVFVFLPPSDEA